jgi:hypothetical protein
VCVCVCVCVRVCMCTYVCGGWVQRMLVKTTKPAGAHAGVQPARTQNKAAARRQTRAWHGPPASTHVPTPRQQQPPHLHRRRVQVCVLLGDQPAQVVGELRRQHVAARLKHLPSGAACRVAARRGASRRVASQGGGQVHDGRRGACVVCCRVCTFNRACQCTTACCPVCARTTDHSRQRSAATDLAPLP